jgi:excisionase family DNA binding protein
MTEQLLTITELRKRTQESESAWRKRLLRGELPYLKLGANVRVRVEDFEAWLAARTIQRKRA